LSTNDVSERELQKRIRGGDETAFDAVFRDNYAHLVRMAESIVRERALAEEIAQDVMLELWRRRETIAVEQSFRAYLLRSTRNRALNHVRHQRIVMREATIAAAAAESARALSAEDEMLGTELERAVRKAIEENPDPKKLEWWIYVIAHSNGHFGNLVTYYRENGLVPPSSRQ